MSNNEVKPIYVGNGKKIGNQGSMKLTINMNKLAAAVKAGECNSFKSEKTGELYVNVTVWDNGQPDQYGNQYAVKTDTFKPDTEKAKQNLETVAKAVVDRIDAANDLHF